MLLETLVNFKKFLPVPVSQDEQIFVTKDIDFGRPGLVKKVYKVIVTYSSSEIQSTPFEYSINGTQSFSDFTGNFADTGGTWDVLTLTTATPIACQSLQIRFNPPSAGKYEINDMTIQYRTIGNREAT